MKLHRDLDITQKITWHLAHRIREAFNCDSGDKFQGPDEFDEAYGGSNRANMSKQKHEELKGAGHVSVGKTVVVEVKGWETNEFSVEVIEETSVRTLQDFVATQADADAKIDTDGKIMMLCA